MGPLAVEELGANRNSSHMIFRIYTADIKNNKPLEGLCYSLENCSLYMFKYTKNRYFLYEVPHLWLFSDIRELFFNLRFGFISKKAANNYLEVIYALNNKEKKKPVKIISEFSKQCSMCESHRLKWINHVLTCEACGYDNIIPH